MRWDRARARSLTHANIWPIPRSQVPIYGQRYEIGICGIHDGKVTYLPRLLSKRGR